MPGKGKRQSSRSEISSPLRYRGIEPRVVRLGERPDLSAAFSLAEAGGLRSASAKDTPTVQPTPEAANLEPTGTTEEPTLGAEARLVPTDTPDEVGMRELCQN